MQHVLNLCACCDPIVQLAFAGSCDCALLGVPKLVDASVSSERLYQKRFGSMLNDASSGVPLPRGRGRHGRDDRPMGV